MSDKDRYLKDIIADAEKRRLFPKDPPEPEPDYIMVPKCKIVRDTMIKVKIDPITQPNRAAILLKTHIDQVVTDSEVLAIILLNSNNNFLATVTIAEGTHNQIVTSLRQVFSIALSKEFNASGFILGHNHPTGDPHPSAEDIEFMYAVRDEGARLHCYLRDFIITTHGHNQNNYYSHRNQSFDL